MHRLSVKARGILVVLALCTSFTARPAEPLAFPKVHRVDGGAGEMFANAYIIEGRSGVVVVDGLLSRTASSALRERVMGLNKPVLAVVVTHGHPDHYGGIAQVVNGSSTIPVVATAGVDAIIRRDDAMKGAQLAAAGFDWAKVRTFPNVLVREGVEITFGDITLRPIDVGAAESHHDSLWVLHGPEGKQVFVGDLIMEGVHANTADAHTGHWLAALGRHAALLRAATTIYPGHGEPGHAAGMLERQARYLEKFRAEVLELARGRASLSPEQSTELERRMVRFAGHDRVSRWVIEGGSPVARELAIDSGGATR
jgi:glyoxylase-like metal-dependent hydrolase (beta-lactamase superfamily II)